MMLESRSQRGGFVLRCGPVREWQDSVRISDADMLTVRSNMSRALGPDYANNAKPLIEHRTEPPRSTIFNHPT